MTATTQVPLALSYTEHYINATLEAMITDVVDAIIEQDTSDRGAWTYVITKRIAQDSTYTEQEAARKQASEEAKRVEIELMRKSVEEYDKKNK